MVVTVILKISSSDSSPVQGHIRGSHPEKFQRTHVVSSEITPQTLPNVFLTIVFLPYTLPLECFVIYLEKKEEEKFLY